jgi:uncharacterized membrane protein YidH (DUF202 family)
MACTRTALSKGRTGLAFIRTGISFMAIALVFFRIFGPGYLTIPEALLFIAGVIMTVDGIIWYLPARRSGKKKFTCTLTEATWGTTVLEVRNPGNNPVFVRTAPVKGAERLREEWKNLSPVMRRRFLASDRTDFAEERTVLACYRTAMARARTGLAFTRTGIAFAGLGIAFLRQFHPGTWSIFDASLIMTGAVMAAEGFYWYVPGRMAGKEGFAWIRKAGDMESIWDFVFPPTRRRAAPEEDSASSFLKKACSPGIWATTGLALERTVLADRRNVMARLRTIMARSRTGMSLVRTGMSIFAVGTGLLMYFGSGNIPWAVFDIVLMVAGFLLIADGLLWHLPAEKIRRQFPYCFGDMEITVPDYGKPNCTWGKVVFTHDDVR